MDEAKPALAKKHQKSKRKIDKVGKMQRYVSVFTHAIRGGSLGGLPSLVGENFKALTINIFLGRHPDFKDQEPITIAYTL